MNVFCVKEKLPEIRLEEDIYPATPPLSIWLANVTSSDHTCDISTKRERGKNRVKWIQTRSIFEFIWPFGLVENIKLISEKRVLHQTAICEGLTHRKARYL